MQQDPPLNIKEQEAEWDEGLWHQHEESHHLQQCENMTPWNEECKSDFYAEENELYSKDYNLYE